ncbi:hypothetical protein DWZ11_01030 [Megamonas rupellensis]|uniref:Uncharacterized protein n=1 Tax=Megamonas rupellensis TaxID=491921 RepID=A0A412A057_9FIRM|nr:hypothetical protein [Megamonas rupellensis]RGQ08471.1 hypothetical protein DWZ11_01030 [Megamonas rupellensis]
MTEEQLNDIEKKLLDEIDKPLKLEKEIKELSSKIAQDLLLKQKVRINFNDKDYYIVYKLINNKTIYILAADTVKYKLLNNKYKPYVASAEIMQNVTEYESVRGVIEALLKRMVDIIEPEEIE